MRVTDVLSLLETHKRPRLLMQAARLAAENYRRDRHLHRLLGCGASPGIRAAALGLMGLEQRCEDARCAGDAAYSAARHIEIMAALICEARMILDRTPDQVKASPTSALRLVI